MKILIKKYRSTQQKHPVFLLCFTSALLAFLLMGAILIVGNLAPFGNNSVVCNDANIQYLDFFSYFKDVLAGKNNIFYTFSKGLGGTAIGLYSYYLASPFNLLVVFFKKTQLHTFFDLVVSLKITTCAVTMCFFLQKRFNEKIKSYIVMLLSLGYAFTQYNIAQSSNVMWLDGVYMLPLILLGVYNIVNKNTGILFTVSLALSIIFNWYTAAINGLFSVVWLIFEIGNRKLKFESEKNYPLKQMATSILRYLVFAIIAVGISAFLFLPTVLDLKNGRGSSLDWNLVFQNRFTSNIFSVFEGFVYGSFGTPERVVLFCGSIALLGCLMFFFETSYRFRQKCWIGLFLIIHILFYYYYPSFMLFSLLKYPLSYWFRYMYGTVFFLIFIAALFFQKNNTSDKKIVIAKKYILVAIGFSFLLLLLQYFKGFSLKRTIAACCVLILISAILALLSLPQKFSKKHYILIGILIVISCFELGINSSLILKVCRTSKINNYQTYVKGNDKLIKDVQKKNKFSFFRIDETLTRNMNNEVGLTANYNESLAYNYSSRSTYTSTNYTNTLMWFDHVGYKAWFDNLNTAIQPNIAVDSLLSVKYLLSPYDINGFDKVSKEKENGKFIYENQEIFPIAFSYDQNKRIWKGQNPFEYMNDCINQLTGLSKDYYQKAEFKKDITLQKDQYISTYRVNIPQDKHHYALYANFPWKNTTNATIDLNHRKSLNYSTGLSPSVVYVPTNDDDTEAIIRYQSRVKDATDDDQIYLLDLDLLHEAAKIAQKNAAQNIKIRNGHVSCNINVTKKQELFLSIPYNSGWKITRNGQQIKINQFEKCFISIPLKKGNNKIEMTYQIPGLKMGIFITIISILVLIQIVDKARENNKTRAFPRAKKRKSSNHIYNK